MTNDSSVTDEIMTNYVTFLLSGFTINDIEIRSDTIKQYMKVVNKYYDDHRLPMPFDPKSKSRAAILVREQEKFESDPARREPVPDLAWVKMAELAEDGDPLGFRATVFDIATVGKYGGCRQQEFAMDTVREIKTYVLPNGVEVIRAFCVKNFHYRDSNRDRVSYPLVERARIEELGTEYEVQKNRRNGQIIWFRRERRYPLHCPVIRSLKLVWRAETLGQGPEDPLCVFRNKDGDVQCLTGQDVTAYLRFVVKLVQPNITDEELKLISTHSIRVTACCLLAEAGKDGWYIKLRLRWVSDCYEVYIRNTRRIAVAHNEALEDVNKKLQELAVTPVNLPDILEESGILDTVEYVLEDDD